MTHIYVYCSVVSETMDAKEEVTTILVSFKPKVNIDSFKTM